MAKKISLNDFDSLYDVAKAGVPLPKQALTLIGNEMKSANEISEKEERKEKMQNPKIRYAMDRFGYVHDKTCYRVARTPYNDLKWMKDGGANLTFCKDCYRKALIRRGIEKDIKKLDDYVAFFDEHKVSNYNLKEMFMICNIQIRLLSENILWIKEREDTWKIEYDYETQTYVLWHNSYTEKDGKRYMTGDYHKQRTKINQSFKQAFNYIESYSNKKHVEKPSIKDEQKSKELTGFMDDSVNGEKKSAERKTVWEENTEYKMLQVSIPNDVYEKLNSYCGDNLTCFVTKLLKDGMQEYEDSLHPGQEKKETEQKQQKKVFTYFDRALEKKQICQ